MDNWLKALIAAACLVICAFGAYTAWDRWQARRAAEDNRAAMWDLLKAAPGDVEKATQTCNTVKRNLLLADGLSWDADTRNGAKQLLAICNANGFI